jgi:ligand-binding SRPBCC domain-containing protein
MGAHRLERRQLVPAPRSQVFQFFSRAENLQRLTPPFVSFRILTPLPIDMKRGQLIEYRIGLGRIPLRWLTEIREWQPDERFVDVQLRGPYRRWHHLHEFREVEHGTEMRDVVDYELPLGPLGDLVHSLSVRRTLERIFDFRRQAVSAHFQPI